MTPRRKLSGMADAYRKAGPYMELGIQLAASILVCVFAGYWLDGELGTRPAFVLGGALLGMAAGFYSFFRAIAQLDRKEKEKKKEDS